MTGVSSKEKSSLPAQSITSEPPKGLFKMATGHARYFRYILFAFFVCGLHCYCVDERPPSLTVCTGPDSYLLHLLLINRSATTNRAGTPTTRKGMARIQGSGRQHARSPSPSEGCPGNRCTTHISEYCWRPCSSNSSRPTHECYLRHSCP